MDSEIVVATATVDGDEDVHVDAGVDDRSSDQVAVAPFLCL